MRGPVGPGEEVRPVAPLQGGAPLADEPRPVGRSGRFGTGPRERGLEPRQRVNDRLRGLDADGRGGGREIPHQGARALELEVRQYRRGAIPEARHC